MSKLAEPQTSTQCFMCSNIMRDPAVFDSYGPSIANVARDVAIWIALQHHHEATLPVREFARTFGYSDAFLFKKVKPERLTELKRLGFGPELKDVIGYTLAKLTVQNLIFGHGYFAVGLQGVEEVKQYQSLQIIRELKAHTSKKGTYYSFLASRTFLANCHKRFQIFSLDTYLSLKTERGNALGPARKMYLHLLWKRRVWDKAKKAPGAKPSHSMFEELVKVAGFDYGDQARSAHQLRELLATVANLPGVEMSAEVEYQQDTSSYTVKFRRHAPAQ